MCVCMCLWEGGREERGKEREREGEGGRERALPINCAIRLALESICGVSHAHSKALTPPQWAHANLCGTDLSQACHVALL